MNASDDLTWSSEDALLALLRDPEAVISRIESAIARSTLQNSKELRRQRDELREFFAEPVKSRGATT